MNAEARALKVAERTVRQAIIAPKRASAFASQLTYAEGYIDALTEVGLLSSAGSFRLYLSLTDAKGRITGNRG